MSRSSRLFVSAIAALIISAPASAQLGGIGGAVGGVVGGVTGGIGSTVGGATGTVGNVTGAVGGALSGGGGGGGRGSGGLGGSGGLSGRLSSLQVNTISDSLLGNGIGDDLLEQVSLDRLATVQPIGLSSMTPEQEADLRMLRFRAMVAANRATLDLDPRGLPVQRLNLVAADPDAVSLRAAGRAGFAVVGSEFIPDLGIQMVKLGVPRRMNVRQAMNVLRKAAPALQVDYDHVYEPAGGALLPAFGAALAASAPRAGRQRIAMIDGGVAAHPSLARASIEQRGFAGTPQPTGHGTAVGSLLVGEQGPFHGAARGAQLYVADVYGGNPAAGSVANIVRALGWAASKRPSVINISLVGPDNRILSRAIAALRARGIAVTAAVGNDGPAAPPQYPASYPGVVAVTAVDARGHALPEAGKSLHLDFAAPGADMAAALPGRGYTRVRGTSFAAPLAAARLALTGSYQRLAAEAVPGKGRVGRGIVCAQCRIDPRVFRAK